MERNKNQEYSYRYPLIKCGEIYEPILPEQLQQYEQPIVLAEVEINLESRHYLDVQLKFSEFIQFEILGIESKLELSYRLVREDRYLKKVEILQEWLFGIESLEKLEIDNISTSQPTVLNYCDKIENIYGLKAIYRLEITQITTHQVKNYKLTNKSFIATVLQQECSGEDNLLPSIKQAQIFNPVLPNKLKPIEQSSILAQVPICVLPETSRCLFINFSAFVTSSLKGAHFNNLLFRLIKVYTNGYECILDEWAFRRVFVNDTCIKEPIVYNYCEYITEKKGCEWLYRMELIGADLSDESFYEITQKSMTVQVDSTLRLEESCCWTVCEKRITPKNRSILCGSVYPYPIESKQIPLNQSIELAKVIISRSNTKEGNILINYSQNFSFTLDGFSPKLMMIYRLVRLSKLTRKRVILESWIYKVAEVIGTQVESITSIEPLVLNYCDKVRNYEEEYIYTVELEKSVTEDTQFVINPKEMVAIVSG